MTVFVAGSINHAMTIIRVGQGDMIGQLGGLPDDANGC